MRESEKNEMAQKKKAPMTKATEKQQGRKAAPAKPAATAKPVPKSAVKAKAESVRKLVDVKFHDIKAETKAQAAKAHAAKVQPTKAKPATVVPVKALKKVPAQPIKLEAKAQTPLPAAAVKKLATVPVKPAVIAHAAKAIVAPQRAVPAAVQKPLGQKLTAPVASMPVQTPKAIAEKTAAARQLLAAQKKPVNQRHGFKANEFIVYPAHGVGRIVGIEEQEIAGMSLELFVINFEKEKLTLRVPTGKLQSVGMRKLADDGIVKKAMEILKGRARIKRTMWSRRAQEYVAKINSGDLISIAEVVRDLYRSEAQPEQSYSERQLYEDALDRMAREIAAVEKLDERGAVQRITEVLSKSAKSRRLAAESEPSVGEAA